MATLHLMIGLPCAGKTTVAKKLEHELSAIRFTPDEWHRKLFGQDAEHPDHTERHANIEALLWNVAAALLTKDVDVILDFGMWFKDERAEFRARAAKLGAKTVIHYLDVPHEELFKRLAQRNKQDPKDITFIPLDMLKEWLPLFEAPDEEELSLNGL